MHGFDGLAGWHWLRDDMMLLLHVPSTVLSSSHISRLSRDGWVWLGLAWRMYMLALTSLSLTSPAVEPASQPAPHVMGTRYTVQGARYTVLGRRGKSDTRAPPLLPGCVLCWCLRT